MRNSALICLIVGIGAGMAFLKPWSQPQEGDASPVTLRKPGGHPQLVSIEPLPAMDGEMCQWVPASAGTTLAAVLQGPATPATGAGNTVDADRAPVRTLRDTYPDYSVWPPSVRKPSSPTCVSTLC